MRIMPKNASWRNTIEPTPSPIRTTKAVSAFSRGAPLGDAAGHGVDQMAGKQRRQHVGDGRRQRR